ncbi:MAG TPA: aldose 1-epimerase [Vicinamibacterales bacterium]|jgi:aldose 1-epimerase|nr:aldose 1-epimerase [Vicinamibacterales bacterium]
MKYFFAVVAFFAFHGTAAAQYAVRRTPDLVQLEDTARQIVVAIAPSAGNLTREMTVKGHNILGPQGIPFLAPWANRLDEQAFYANGKRYAFDMQLGNVRGAHPIHGFLAAAKWEVVEARADAGSAWVTSRLEFFKQPDWMAQFPFAHTISITHRLKDGALDVAVELRNLSAEPMPVAVGFHPYFRVDDAPRDAWTIGVGAKTEWLLSPDKIPTGETRPIEQRFSDPRAAVLREHDLDHVFADLRRDSAGMATMSLAGTAQRIDVLFGPAYRAAVIYAPKGRDFICFEPMAGITDSMNLAQRGLYKDLQHVPPGGTWQEHFVVRPSGF